MDQVIEGVRQTLYSLMKKSDGSIGGSLSIDRRPDRLENQAGWIHLHPPVYLPGYDPDTRYYNNPDHFSKSDLGLDSSVLLKKSSLLMSYGHQFLIRPGGALSYLISFEWPDTNEGKISNAVKPDPKYPNVKTRNEYWSFSYEQYKSELPNNGKTNAGETDAKG